MTDEVYPDMSYEACKNRYDERRQRIIDAIKQGGVSPSMSGIEWCMLPWDEMPPNDWDALGFVMTWNGQAHIKRNWRAELEQKHPLSPEATTR